MKTNGMLLLVAAVIAGAPAPAPAEAPDRRPMGVTSLTGNLHIVQGIPCNNTVTRTTQVTGGRLELTPAEGVDVTGGKRFALTRADVSFDNFSVSGSCLGFNQTRSFSQVSVQLSHVVSFTAAPAGPGAFAVTIPKDAISFDQAAVVNGVLESDVTDPTQDVTGTIDLANGTVALQVVVATSVRFQAGCVAGECAIDETDTGTLTVNVAGTIAFPDTDADAVPTEPTTAGSSPIRTSRPWPRRCSRPQRT